MMRKKLGYLMVGTLLVGLLQACGGGGGGSDAPAVDTTITVASSQAYDASAYGYEYTVPAGVSGVSFSNMATGDKLIFPAGTIEPDTADCANKNLVISWHSNSDPQFSTVTLTGLDPVVCGGAYNFDRLKILYGAGWIQ